MKTYSAKPGEIARNWYVVDADGQTLGRLATRIADTLRGKGKPAYTPHVDTGDFVIVVNAEKIRVTGNKLDQKRYYRHSGYPGGLRSRTLREELDRRRRQHAGEYGVPTHRGDAGGEGPLELLPGAARVAADDDRATPAPERRCAAEALDQLERKVLADDPPDAIGPEETPAQGR